MSLLSVDSIKSYFSKEGFAFANRYAVYMPNVPGYSVDDSKDLNIMCNRVTVPGRQILTSDYYTSMRVSRRAYAFGVNEITMSFMLSNDWKAWDYIDQWQKQCIDNLDKLDGYKVGYKNDYCRDIRIQHLDTQGIVKRQILIQNAFPTTLTPLEFSNTQSEVVNCIVTLQFENWKEL